MFEFSPYSQKIVFICPTVFAERLLKVLFYSLAFCHFVTHQSEPGKFTCHNVSFTKDESLLWLHFFAKKQKCSLNVLILNLGILEMSSN